MAAWFRRVQYVEVRVSRPATRWSLVRGLPEKTRHILDDPRFLRGAIGGLLGGAVGGLAVLAYSLVLRFLDGQDAWLASKLYALPLFGEIALQPGFHAWSVLGGLSALIIGGAVIGTGFGLATHRLRAKYAVPLGGAMGLLLWLAGRTLMWPRLPVAWTTHAATLMPEWASLVQLILFWLCVGFGVTAFQLPREFWRRFHWRRSARA